MAPYVGQWWKYYSLYICNPSANFPFIKFQIPGTGVRGHVYYDHKDHML